MPELALYRNPEIQYAPRINLQVADKALATMEQNHLKTIELQGELEAAVNAMDLDESENEYKAGLINEIKQSVDNSTIDGYSGYALSDIVKKYGDIKGNPVLRGKVLANAAHKANDKLLDELAIKGTISSDTAAYFKAKNPYYKPGAVTYSVAVTANQIASAYCNRLGMDYTREQEDEADEIACKLMKVVGYDSNALATALSRIEETMKQERQFLWSHCWDTTLVILDF